MAKKAKAHLSAKVELKVTASQLRGPVDKAKVRSRGPGHIGQMKDSSVVHLGNIAQDELAKRMKWAKQVLQTGRMGSAKPPETKRTDTSKKEVSKSKPATPAPVKKEEPKKEPAKKPAEKKK